MSQHYSDPSHIEDSHALPDIETFQLTATEVAESSAYQDEQYEFMRRPEFRLANMNSRDRERMLDAMVAELGIEGGWFWWACFPGCLPDSDPIGPFETEAEALADARESRGLCPHGVDDESVCEECPAPVLYVIVDPSERFLHFMAGALNGGSCAAWSNRDAAEAQLAKMQAAGLVSSEWRVRLLPDDLARRWGHDDNE